MTDQQQQHPITPPDELVRQWETTNGTVYTNLFDLCQSVATQAARWGADQQLESCCEWVEAYAECGNALRAACRPRPKSQAEEALEQTNAILNDPNRALLTEVRETLELNRRALERLRELEKSND